MYLQVMRAYLVRNATLAVISRAYRFPERIIGSPYTTSALRASWDEAANVFEAYLWGAKEWHGLERVQQWIDAVFAEMSQLLYKDLKARMVTKKRKRD